jgi:hypothetical protein
LVAVLVSAWSVEPDDPVCCAARVVTPPKISSMDATSANTITLLDFMWLSPSVHLRLPRAKHISSY